MVGTLPEMVQTIVPKDFTQYCSSPPLCTMISYGYTLSLGRIFCLVIIACACTEIKLAIYRHVARHNLSLRPQLKLVNKSGNLNSTVLFVLLLESK